MPLDKLHFVEYVARRRKPPSYTAYCDVCIKDRRKTLPADLHEIVYCDCNHTGVVKKQGAMPKNNLK